MKRLILSTFLTLTLGLSLTLTGCLGQNKKLMTVDDQGIAHWNSSIAGVTTQVPWWAKNTAGLSKKDNPWEKFVTKKKEDNWHDPWAQSDPVLAPVSKLPRAKAVKVERRILTRVKVFVVPKDSLPQFLQQFPKLRSKLFAPRNQSFKQNKKEVY